MIIYYPTYYNEVRNRLRNINENIFNGVEEAYVDERN